MVIEFYHFPFSACHLSDFSIQFIFLSVLLQMMVKIIILSLLASGLFLTHLISELTESSLLTIYFPLAFHIIYYLWLSFVVYKTLRIVINFLVFQLNFSVSPLNQYRKDHDYISPYINSILFLMPSLFSKISCSFSVFFQNYSFISFSLWNPLPLILDTSPFIFCSTSIAQQTKLFRNSLLKSSVLRHSAIYVLEIKKIVRNIKKKKIISKEHSLVFIQSYTDKKNAIQIYPPPLSLSFI